MENDSTYNKYVQTESSYMDSYYDHNTVDSIHFWPETTTKVVPLYLARKNSYFLPKFAWYEDLRPWSPEDVFNVPQAMIDLINSADPVSSTVAERKTKESERRRPNAAAPPEPVPKTEKLPDKPDEPEAPDKPDAPDAPKNSGQDEPQHDQSTES